MMTNCKPQDVESWKLLDPHSKVTLREALQFDYDFVVLPIGPGRAL